jgi:hypothetical protein
MLGVIEMAIILLSKKKNLTFRFTTLVILIDNL